MKVMVRNNTGFVRRSTLLDGTVLEIKPRGFKIIDGDLLTNSLLNARDLRKITIAEVRETPSVSETSSIKEEAVVSSGTKTASKKTKATEKEGEK